MSAPINLPDILELDITADDIARGVKGDPHHCAIARALKRLGIDAWVRTGIAILSDHSVGFHYDIGEQGRAFIRAFDEDKLFVEPCRITAMKVAYPRPPVPAPMPAYDEVATLASSDAHVVFSSGSKVVFRIPGAALRAALPPPLWNLHPKQQDAFDAEAALDIEAARMFAQMTMLMQPPMALELANA